MTMAITLTQRTIAPQTYYRGSEIFEKSAGQNLNKIDVSPNMQVPEGKVWVVQATIQINESDAA